MRTCSRRSTRENGFSGFRLACRRGVRDHGGPNLFALRTYGQKSCVAKDAGSENTAPQNLFRLLRVRRAVSIAAAGMVVLRPNPHVHAEPGIEVGAQRQGQNQNAAKNYS